MAARGAFLVPTTVTYQQLLAGGAAAGMAPELVQKVGALVEQARAPWLLVRPPVLAGSLPGGRWRLARRQRVLHAGASPPPHLLAAHAPFAALPSEQGLEAIQVAAAAGVTQCYGSDLLGELHRHQLGEFALRARVLPPQVRALGRCASAVLGSPSARMAATSSPRAAQATDRSRCLL